jgi:hypothetical protein
MPAIWRDGFHGFFVPRLRPPLMILAPGSTVQTLAKEMQAFTRLMLVSRLPMLELAR